MNDFELDKIGNADLQRMSSHGARVRSTSPQKKQDQSESKLLHLQSNIGNNFFLCGHSKQQHEMHGKCTKVTKTKWDKFSPYSFHKLNNQQKDETFLQLYEDYRGTKAKHNEEVHKNRRLNTELHRLEAQLGRLKTNGVNPGERYKYDKERNEENDSLKQQIKRLHEKIVALTGTKHKFQSRPKTANKPQKAIIPVNQNIRQELQQQRKHVRELLLIIDELKKNKFQVEEQLKTKQAAGGNVNVSQVRTNKNKSKLYPGGTESQFNQFANDLHVWKEKYNDLELMYTQMNTDKDKKIRQLSTQLITIKENQRMKQRIERRGGQYDVSQVGKLESKVKQITLEKQKLEDQLRKLVQMPFYRDNKQVVDAQEKIKNLQIKYTKTKEEYAKVNESNSKLIAELEFKNRQAALIKSENEKVKKQLKQFMDKEHAKVGSKTDVDYDDYYRKMLALVKLEGDDPVWKKFEAMAKPEVRLMNEEKAKALAEKLWLDKIQLLSHLQKAQIQLKTLKQGMDSRINLYIRDKQTLEQELKIARARLDQWKGMDNINQRKTYKVYQQAGINYDDSVSVFDVEEKQMRELESTENYFDIYLGHINIDEGVLMKNPQNKIKNTSHFVSFLTIDFYNHETQHSNFAQGVMKKLGNNYSFKVQVNTYYLKYISKNTVSLQLWSPQGTATVLLGKGQIYLSQLINKAAPEISNVIRGKCQIYYNQKTLIATVEYRFRMRTPIFPYIEWAENKNQFKASESRDPFLMGKKRIMEISVQRAEGLPLTINSFVYFTIQEQDFFTEPERGSSPLWNFKQQVTVTMNEQFLNDLKQKYFKFTIFDDEKQVNEDVYGIAQANLTPILEQTDLLDLLLDIEDLHGEKKGKLKVRVKWLSY